MSVIVFSIGYQGKSLATVCDAVAASGVTRLLDVRDRAWSQRPDFRKGVLSAALAARGVAYVHHKAAGNPTRPKTGEGVSAESCAAAFRAHLAGHPEVVPDLIAQLRDGPVAMFCFERHRSECHRGVLIEEIERLHRDFTIIDL